MNTDWRYFSKGGGGGDLCLAAKVMTQSGWFFTPSLIRTIILVVIQAVSFIVWGRGFNARCQGRGELIDLLTSAEATFCTRSEFLMIELIQNVANDFKVFAKKNPGWFFFGYELLFLWGKFGIPSLHLRQLSSGRLLCLSGSRKKWHLLKLFTNAQLQIRANNVVMSFALKSW